MSRLIPYGVGETSYGRCWDRIASRRIDAIEASDGSQSEVELEQNGRELAQRLIHGLALHKSDTVLEIGCGIARLGKEIAPKVGRFLGVDVSFEMLKLAKERLQVQRNTLFCVNDGSDLSCVGPHRIDKVFSHWVFIHMDKEDLFGYLRDVGRVLRPGGLFYFDIWNLCDDVGWLRWQVERARHPRKDHRPIHRNQFTTPDELRMMIRMAGGVIISWVETFALHVVVSYPPIATEHADFERRMREEHGDRCASLSYNEHDKAGYKAAMLAFLESAGEEPELLGS